MGAGGGPQEKIWQGRNNLKLVGATQTIYLLMHACMSVQLKREERLKWMGVEKGLHARLHSYRRAGRGLAIYSGGRRGLVGRAFSVLVESTQLHPEN